MDVKDEYEYNNSSNILTILDPACYLKKGRAITLVFIDKNSNPVNYTDIQDEIYYINMEFKVNEYGMTQIPEELYKNPDIQFNSSNLLLFINGVFLEPERWSIIQPGNWIKFNDNPEIAGYEEPYKDKTFTGVYLLTYSNVDKPHYKEAYSQKEIDPSEDNDKVRFDEMYARVKRKS